MEELYTKDGWLNFEYLDSKNCWLNVILGHRQIGKTYGTLKMLLDGKRKFIYLRRTREEMDTVASNDLISPFNPMAKEGHVVTIQKAGNVWDIRENDESIGFGLGLPAVAGLRGFSGDAFTDLLFDEFIPEKGVRVLKTEADTFLNAYVTINGNREMEGRPPLRVWLLANPNNINSQILSALGLSDRVITMTDRDEEYYCNNGVQIFRPKSAQVTEAHRGEAFFEHLLQTNSAERFLGMALDNKFAYDETMLVGKLPMNGLKPICGYGDKMYFWERNDGYVYVCRAPHKKAHYENTEYDAERFRDRYLWMPDYYRAKRIKFADPLILSRFKEIFKITY